MTQPNDSLKQLIGVHGDMPADLYHALPGASASRLMKLWTSTPAHLKLQLDQAWEPTPAMMIGSLGHSMLLEPDKPLSNLWLIPETYGDGKKWNGNATECKALIKKAFDSGLIPVKKADYDNAVGASRALAAHPLVAPVLADCETELTLITWDSTNDVGVRCRFDVKPAVGYPNLVDCKFTASLDRDAWPKHAWGMGYALQASLNLKVWNQCAGVDDPKTGFEFWVVENRPPFDVIVFECEPEFIERGWDEVRKTMPVYAACERSGIWPGSKAEKVKCGLPKWV